MKFVAPAIREGKAVAQLQKPDVDAFSENPTIAAVSRFIATLLLLIGTSLIFSCMRRGILLLGLGQLLIRMVALILSLASLSFSKLGLQISNSMRKFLELFLYG